MNANQIYVLPAQSLTCDLDSLVGCYYNHIPEVETIRWLGEVKQWRIQIKTVKFFDFDGRRYWSLQTVWFDGNPVMIIQNAGREGDDHAERFITDREIFLKMVDYVRSIIVIDQSSIDQDIIDPTEDLPGLTEFYGNSLNGVFERH